MAANVEPEEVQAIMDLSQQASGDHPVEVAARDFERPIRLSPEELERVRQKLRAAVPEIESELARALRRIHALELVETGEVNSEGLLADLAAPLAVMRFEIGGQPGWLVWEPAAALAAIEVMLGATEPAEMEPRPLTSVERATMTRLLTVVVNKITGTLGIEVTNVYAPDTADKIGTWHDGGQHADRRRLHLHLAFEGPGGASALRMYLPGVDPVAPDDGDEEVAAALPEHLESVRLSVAARLGQSDIPLSELLEIEPGDVIPLSAQTDEPLRIYVEDRLCAYAALGSKQGNLAVRILEIDPENEEQ